MNVLNGVCCCDTQIHTRNARVSFGKNRQHAIFQTEFHIRINDIHITLSFSSFLLLLLLLLWYASNISSTEIPLLVFIKSSIAGAVKLYSPEKKRSHSSWVLLMLLYVFPLLWINKMSYQQITARERNEKLKMLTLRDAKRWREPTSGCKER